MSPLLPAVTDELPIAIRAYATPTFRMLPDAEGRAGKRKRKPSKIAASRHTLIFDTETTPDAAQALRFGTYQFRFGDEVDENGIFYDPDRVSEDELTTLRTHAHAHGLVLRTRIAFVDEVFFAKAYRLRATIVGFNLPFDLSRLALTSSTARTPTDSDTGGMRGGFTFKLSHQKIYPNVRVKHMSAKAASISFAAPMRQPDGRGQRNRGMMTGIRRGHFIDVKTLANALFARGFSLKDLSDFLEVPHPKLDFDEFDGPITDEMVGYAVRDVLSTWECYTDLIGRFDKLGLSRTKPQKVYSEAGIGKGYIREMGIRPWRDVQPDFPSYLTATIMGCYFGGRSETRIRREVRQVILCDFLSMYPSVCTLMGLWRFVIADGMTWRDSTEDARAFLASDDLALLSSPATWPQLATLVRVMPDADIFPVRAAYTKKAEATIGLNGLSGDRALWFTMADCVASKLLTGKSPAIVEALSFAPGAVQSGLMPINVAGNPDYPVDPNTTDFFKRVIELRKSVQVRKKDANGAEYHRLDTEQNALKICANSTSYGIWVETNVDTRPTRRMVTVHTSTCDPFSFKTDKAELPGTYFHPLLATLITGAARLMLAITERLVTDAGLEWAICDTDSMAIARPVDISGEEFERRVRSVVGWFTTLNPYEFGGSILKIEDVNASLESGEPEPLYCFAVSTKRYALFNLAPDGSPIMRKVTAHGLGHLLPPYEAPDAPSHFPVPDDTVLERGIHRWHCDLWHQIVTAALAGTPDRVRLVYHPALSAAAMSRYAATSPQLLAWFKKYNASRPARERIKAFNFLLAMMPARTFESRLAEPAKRGRRKKVRKAKPIAAFERNHGKAAAAAFDRETGAAVPIDMLQTYAEAIAHHHLSPESKFLNGRPLDRGATLRRHIRMGGTKHIGKESHEWERQAALALSLDDGVEYGQTIEDLPATLSQMRNEFGDRAVSAALAIPLSRFSKLANGQTDGSNARWAVKAATRASAARQLCERLSSDRRMKLREIKEAIERDGLRATARRLGVDASNLRRRLRGAP